MMIQRVTQFAKWVAGAYCPEEESGYQADASSVAVRIAAALNDARKAAAADGRSPTLLDYFVAAEKRELTAQQMADLSCQDVSGFIIARAHLEDSRLPYLRSHGITVRGSKLDRCRLVPMTVMELMALDSSTSMREAEFVAG